MTSVSVLRKIIKTAYRTPVLIALILCSFLIISKTFYYQPPEFMSFRAVEANDGDINIIEINNANNKNASLRSPETSTWTTEKGGAQIFSQRSSKQRKIKVVQWTYVCLKDSCVRREVDNDSQSVLVSFEVCWLTCGSHGSLWPYPITQRRGPDTVQVLPENINLVEIKAETEAVRLLIKDAFEIKQQHFRNLMGGHRRQNKNQSFWPWSYFWGDDGNNSPGKSLVNVHISTNQSDEILTLNTDEAYEISIAGTGYIAVGDKERVQLTVKITGSTFFGVRHGIETFSQLVAFDNLNNCLQIIQDFYAFDKPYYPYRGILVDSARNFIPLNILKRVIDGMSLNKLNVMHMHLSDSNTFPFHSKRVPQMAEYGTIYPHEIYYPEELEDLVKYAKLRGVKLVPELDAPSHAGNGWQFGRKYGMGDLAFYINAYDQSWPSLCGQPPCGILNPININTYNILEKLYADMLDIFDKELFHQGGDEVNLDSWKRQPELKSWLHDRNKLDLWKYFQTEAFKRLRKHSPNVTAILWTSTLTSSEDVTSILKPEDYIIQVWEPATSSATSELLARGYSVIISFVDKVYLDWGGGSWLGRNHKWEYHPWQRQYDMNRQLQYQSYRRVRSKSTQRNKQILGAEATLWSEKVGPYDLETRLWPRAAALAEGFWSNPSSRDGEVYSRINYHNFRMRQQGIPTNQLQPESCMHFNGHCEHPSDII